MSKTNKNYYIYIVASSSGTLYVGITNNLIRRVKEHREGRIQGFSRRYGCNRLIYYEHYLDINAAISREKEIKKWRREKKEILIKSMNPHWDDLWNELF